MKPTELRDATGISLPYASQILSADPKMRRTPSRSLAIHIYRKTGWRHEMLADLTDEQLALLEQVEPWKSEAA